MARSTWNFGGGGSGGNWQYGEAPDQPGSGPTAPEPAIGEASTPASPAASAGVAGQAPAASSNVELSAEGDSTGPAGDSGSFRRGGKVGAKKRPAADDEPRDMRGRVDYRKLAAGSGAMRVGAPRLERR